METIEIKQDNTAFSVVFVLGFETEKDFLEATEKTHYQDKDPKERKAHLKSVYKQAKKL